MVIVEIKSVNEKVTSLIKRFQKKTAIIDTYVFQQEGLFYAGSKNDSEITEIVTPMVASIMNTAFQMDEFLQIGEFFHARFSGKKHSLIIIPFGERFLLMVKVKTHGFSKKLKRYIYSNVRSLNRWLETRI